MVGEAPGGGGTNLSSMLAGMPRSPERSLRDTSSICSWTAREGVSHARPHGHIRILTPTATSHLLATPHKDITHPKTPTQSTRPTPPALSAGGCVHNYEVCST